jgi:fructose-bisphosphate aldolase class I
MDTSSDQFNKVRAGRGFIAALDQSGGSTPKALALYGISEEAYSDDDEMFALMHEFRTRIITSPSFRGDRVLGAIMFEDTMNRQIDGRHSTDYLWGVKGVVPFVKVDKGLAVEADGVQVMKPMPDLDGLLARARDESVFGTKMRSFIKAASPAGIKAVVDQQFELARRILDNGIVPIIEPEVDIHSAEKEAAEMILEPALRDGLSSLGDGDVVMFKLTLPSNDNFYARLVSHPKVLRVVALSGGYSRDEANARLARNHGVIASFSRALTEGLSVDQTDEEFDRVLDQSIASIFEASNT